MKSFKAWKRLRQFGFAVVLFSTFSTNLLAEDASEEKLDEIINTQDKIMETVLDTKGKVDDLVEQYNNRPLDGKKYGIEINPFRILFYDEYESLSGTFSLFKPEKNLEIAFPYMYYDSEINNYDYDSIHKSDVRGIRLDAHLRKFLRNTSNGFYISASTRLVNLDFKGTSHYYEEDEEIEKSINDNVTKLGIGFGFGRRIFSYSGFYWGSSLTVGKFIIGENDIVPDGFFNFGTNDDNSIYLDFECLKFGYAF